MKIYCIEGPDHCGKSTHVKLLQKNLKNLGYKVKYVEIPFQDFSIRPIIYKMLKTGYAKKYPKLFQLLFAINRQIWKNFIKRFMTKYDILILGRWTLSSYIYGLTEGLSYDFIDIINLGLGYPDKTFVLLNKQFKIKEEKDVYERDDILQSKIKDMYKNSQFLYKNAVKINNNRSVEEIQNDLIKQIQDDFYNKRGKKSI